MRHPMHYSPESTRKPASPGVPILAGDGRMWSFAVTTRRYTPVVRGSEVDELRNVVNDVGSVQPARRAVLAARDSGDEPALMLAIFRLALARLRGCHRLSDKQAAEVLTIGEHDVDRFCSEILKTLDDAPAEAPAGAVEPIPLADVAAPTDDAPAELIATIPLAGDDSPAQPPDDPGADEVIEP